MSVPRFTRPKGGSSVLSPNLYIANCGPAVGISFELIASVFGRYGVVNGVYAADESGTRVIVCYDDENSAESAMKALDGRPCPHLGGRALHIRHSVHSSRPVQVNDRIAVSLTDSELEVPGVYLLHDFVTAQEEEELLAAVDDRCCNHLAKRRVQHYGYEFHYDVRLNFWDYELKLQILTSRSLTLLVRFPNRKTRNVNTSQYLGELPSFLSPILERISLFEKHVCATNIILDQLTVNEYPVGVGLSPQLDTHSAFEEYIFSLSLAGPCIMEFRKYPTGTWLSNSALHCEEEVSDANNDSGFLRRAIHLPPRSMLLLSGEARYAWHHYIPHHKVDRVKGQMVRRSTRRVSFTLRKVR